MLTPQQKQKLKSAGYSDSKIAAFEVARAEKEPQAQQEPGYLQRVGSGLKEQALRAAQGAETGAQALEKGVNMTDANGIITPKGVVTAVGGALRSGLRAAGSAANAIATPIVEAPGVKQATETVVGGAVKGIQELPGGAEAFQKLRDLAVKNPEIAKDVEDIFNLVTTGAGAKVAKVGAEGAIGVAKAGEKAVGQGLESGMKLAENVIPKSDEIMNRVARLTPKQATTFEKLAGKTHGEYLRETGNFGTPDQIIKNEAEKFTKSIQSVDETLATLPGTYKSGVIEDALTGLSEKAAATSSKNVKSPILAKVAEYEAKLADGGLTMSEVNDIKRLYERNVKLGYNKLMNADKVEQATNIDNALRSWQVGKAKELGFENIAELNKQTQLSKFIVDKLGDQVVGKNGLNDVTLTDWIMLSGGDPTAVGGFLTKKFFSSKKVQSKIAEMLNKGEVKGQIVPKVTTSKKLPPQQSEKVLEKASTNNTTSGLKSKGTIQENSLISEAKKYKSVEDFVKAQPTMYHSGTADIKAVDTNKSNFQKTFYMSDNKDYSKSYGGKNSTINEIALDKNAKLADLSKPSDEIINKIQSIIESKPTGKMVKIQKPDGTFIEIPEVKGGNSNPVHSTSEIIKGIRDKKAYFAEMPEVKDALKKLGYDGMITQESKFGLNYGVWNKDVVKTKSQLEEIWKKANKK